MSGPATLSLRVPAGFEPFRSVAGHPAEPGSVGGPGCLLARRGAVGSPAAGPAAPAILTVTVVDGAVRADVVGAGVTVDALAAAEATALALRRVGHPRAVAVASAPVGPVTLLEEIRIARPPDRAGQLRARAAPRVVGVSQAHLVLPRLGLVVVTTLATPDPAHLPVCTALLTAVIASMRLQDGGNDPAERP